MVDKRSLRHGRRGGTGKRRGIQSASTGMLVLKAVARASGPLHLREVAHSAGMTTSTAYRYLVSYVDAGLIIQDEASGRYDLGPFSVELGTAALARIDGFSVAGEALGSATSTLDLDGHVSVWGSAGPTVVRWKGRPADVVVRVFEGTVFPFTSATGRLYAALHTPELVASFTRAAIRKGGAAEIRASLQHIRDTGLSFSQFGERRTDIDAICGPILDHNGAVAFAVTLFGPRGRVPTKTSEARSLVFAEILKAATRRVGGLVDS